MEQLYQDYRDLAEFFLIYTTEAHAIDDKHPVKYAKKLGIREHTTYGERCTVADRLMMDKKLTIPCLIDNMDNTNQEAYKSWPTRVFLVRTDGSLGVAAKRGPWGYRPGREAVRKWLAEFRETGKEPSVPKFEEGKSARGASPDIGEPSSEERAVLIGELTRELMEFSRSGDQERALEVALEAHQHAKTLHEQGDEFAAGMLSMTKYNVACMYSVLGRKDKAFEYLNALIDAGGSADDFTGNLADQIEDDKDFDNIRDDPRYGDVLEKAGR
jgi:hypothetical protein